MAADPSVPAIDALPSITLPLVVLACSVEVGVVSLFSAKMLHYSVHLLEATRQLNSKYHIGSSIMYV